MPIFILGAPGTWSKRKTPRVDAEEISMTRCANQARFADTTPACRSRKGSHASRSACTNSRRGFTLIELLMVLAIIGVLSTIALPRLKKYVYRAERNEAYLNLNGIYTDQTIFFNETGRYATSFTELGFSIEGGRLIDPTTIQSRFYTYTITPITVAGKTAANYQAVATGDLDPSDAMLDILMIENNIIVPK